MADRTGVLCFEEWASRIEVPVRIIGETRTRWRVSLGRDCTLPSKRRGLKGDVLLVPKSTVRLDEGE